MEILLANRPLVAAILGALLAQLFKPFFLWPLEGAFRARLFFSSGGMPSAHTAMVVALSTSIFCTEGVKSIAFAIAVTFSLITIHDAMGIRWEAGKQAKVINKWSKILSQIHVEGQFSQENLKTMLGHSSIQVLAGLLLGVVVGYVCTVLI